MPEPISIALTLSFGYAALYGYGRTNTAVSPEAETATRAVGELLEFKERSQSLFGRRSQTISVLRIIANEAAEADWDGYGALPLNRIAAQNAEGFIRALPDNFPMPEIAAEPDGSVSLDWIESRNRMFSMSIGSSDRLIYAWVDGVQRGRAVVSFDGSSLPRHFLADIGAIIDYATSALRAA